MNISVRLALAVCAAFVSQDPTNVELDRALKGTVQATDAVVTSPVLAKDFKDAPVRGRAYRFTATEGDTYTIGLVSPDFDAYLVVRGDDGAVLGEDDDGLILTHARAVVSLAAAQTVTVEACALHGRMGGFELSVRRGEPPRLSPQERAAAEIEAREQQIRALEESSGEDGAELIAARTNLAITLESLGRPQEGLALRRQIVDVHRRLVPDDEAGRLGPLLELGLAEFVLSNWSEATAAYREAVELAERIPGLDPMQRAYAMGNLARSLGEQSLWNEPSFRAEAETWFGRSLELFAATRGAEHAETGALRAEWGSYLARTGRVADGEREIRAGLAAARRGGSPTAIRRIEHVLGLVLLETGRAESAVPLLRNCLESLEREIGPDSFELFGDLRMLTVCLVQLAKFDEAKVIAARAQKLATATSDPTAVVWADELAVMVARNSAPPDELESLLRGALKRAADAGLGETSLVVDSFENSLAMLLAGGDRNAEAEPILRRLLARAEARLGDGHPITARYRINLAHVLANLQHLGEARDLAERAVHALERIQGQELWLADAFVCLGTVDRFAGHDDEAAASLRRALALREAHLPPEHPQVIQLWSDLAAVLDSAPAEAEQYARRAVEVGGRILGADSGHMPRLLGVLASRLASTEQPAEAAECLRRALAILESLLGPESVHSCSCALSLARTLGQLGDTESARALLDASLPRVERGLAAAPEQWRRCQHRVAEALEVTGATAEAEIWIRRSIDTTEATLGPDSPALVGGLKTLGNLLSAQGRFREAEASFRRAIALVESEDGPDAYGLTGLLFDLAILLDAAARTDESLELMQRSLDIRRSRLGDEHPGTLESWSSLAYLLGKARRLREADDLLADVLGRESVQRLDRLSYARLVNLRGLVRFSLGEPDALEWTRRAAAAAADCPGSPLSLVVQLNLPLLEALSGNRTRARQAALETWRMQLAYAMPRIGRWSTQDRFVATAQARVVADLLAHTTDLSDPVEAAGAFEALSASRGIAFRADRGARLAGASGEPATTELVDRLRRLAAEQSALAFARDVDDVDEQARHLRALADEERRCELELLQQRPAETGEWTASVERLRAALPEGSALLAFARLIPLELRHVPREGLDRTSIPGRVLAFVVDATGIRGVDLGESEPLRDATTAFLREIGGGTDGDAGLRTARNDRLRRLLWEPLAPLLTDVRMVFVAPDSFLARLPLEVIADAQGRYLVESHSFVYTSDPRSLLDQLDAPATDRSRSPGLLAVGDVDYAERSAAIPFLAGAERGGFAWDWAPLPETARERDAVAGAHASLGGEVAVLRGADATEERVKALAGASTVLHFATHGFFEPTGVPSLADAAQRRVANEAGALQAPGRIEPSLEGHSPDLLSGLVLAGANRPQPGHDDGYLTAKEVAYLDLSGCELVVLSGCETGVGTSRGGEAMLGLRRAFHTAGAATVISSLWKVRDQPTRELMTAFYLHLWQENASPATALRSAQLEMLSRQRAAGGVDPGAWGAFVLSGDWR